MDARALAPQAFWARHVQPHAPVVLRGALAHWPAVQRWARPGYLEAFGNMDKVLLARAFNMSPALTSAADSTVELRGALCEMRLAGDGDTLSVPALPVPDDWLADLGEFRFLKDAPAPLLYPRRRLFVYKNESTEWHYHPIDETLTCQIAGAKRVSLFRLSPANWSAYAPLIRTNHHHLPCADQLFPPASSPGCPGSRPCWSPATRSTSHRSGGRALTRRPAG